MVKADEGWWITEGQIWKYWPALLRCITRDIAPLNLSEL